MSALEKKDAEHLALLRSGQEASILGAMTEIKSKAIEESVAQINALGQQQKMATQRRDFYQKAVDGGLNAQEQLQLDSMMASIPLHVIQGGTLAFASIANAFPQITVGPFSSGVEDGGNQIAGVATAASEVTGILANINSTIGSMAATKGSFVRRKDEWNLQLKTVNIELKQIDQQILSAQIRKEMAEAEFRNHQLQVQHNAEMDTAMREKYTNEELYDWMTGQIAFTYFQAYKLALDVAKKAERCYHYELPAESGTTFITSGYWDSLHKGLLAGESLSYALKRMETAYLDKNKRQLELSKHISLAAVSPQHLLELKTKKSTTISLPEWLFDLDYPGQHMRRIKSVSLSIPCVAGPYTTVSCKLSLLKGQYRKTGTVAGTYSDAGNYEFQYGSIQSIATSHAQNDSGMFEFSFRDERYLPFEGAGAISTWKIELPAAYAQFDYDSIQDVILHVNYTAVDEGGLKEAAKTDIHRLINLTTPGDTDGFYRAFDLKHEFPNEWNAMLNGANHESVLSNLRSRLPYLVQQGALTVSSITCYTELPEPVTSNVLTVTLTENGIAHSPSVQTQLGDTHWYQHTAITSGNIDTNQWKLSVSRPPTGTPTRTYASAEDVKNIVLIVHYKVGLP